jgi:sugar phosphate isomerase/epimerase
MRLTCTTRSFPQDGLALALARIQWAGFKAAEIAVPADVEEFPDAGQLKDLLARSELDLSGIDAGTLEFGSRAEALEAVAHIGRCALLAHQLEGPQVIFRAVGDRQALAFGLSSLLGAMRGYPFDLCAANASGSLLSVPEDLEELARPLASDRLGLALDPAEGSAAGWDAEEFARAAEVPLRYVYLTDSCNGQPALPGSGDLDWEILLEALRADGYDGYLSLLLPGGDPLTAESDAKEARGYAEALIHRAD